MGAGDAVAYAVLALVLFGAARAGWSRWREEREYSRAVTARLVRLADATNGSRQWLDAKTRRWVDAEIER